MISKRSGQMSTSFSILSTSFENIGNDWYNHSKGE